jgi:hypothetical protein
MKPGRTGAAGAGRDQHSVAVINADWQVRESAPFLRLQVDKAHQLRHLEYRCAIVARLLIWLPVDFEHLHLIVRQAGARTFML